MHVLFGAVAVCAALFAAVPARSAELVDGFDAPPLNRNAWNPCQIFGPTPTFEGVRDPGGTTRHVLRIAVEASTGNIDQCLDGGPAPDASAEGTGAGAPEPTFDVEPPGGLGPSLIARSTLVGPDEAGCPNGADVQRNEIRVRQSRPDLQHALNDAHWYSLTFRVDGYIPSCGSARWVLAQWKQQRGGPTSGGDPGPFLAQRFDNGVLHVTVQADECRCVVAQAEGDPDLVIAALSSAAAGPLMLGETKPIKCVRTDLPDEAPEQLCTPNGMKVLTLGGGRPPDLPDPRRDWVRMTYLVRGGFDGQGRIDIYEGEDFVVRVTGEFGYKVADPGNVKFKFGHYRDRIPGPPASMSVDTLCLSRDVKLCAADLEVQR